MINKEIFNEDSIVIDENLNNKEEVFAFISNYFVNNKYADNYKEIYQGFFIREKEGSTAFTDGIGIPHSKTATIKRPGIFILKNNIGIEWDSLDDKPTFFFIALAIPEKDAEVDHLKMLSSIARKLVDETFKKNLINSKNKEEVFELISKVEIC
ncbi:PTS sugar transporter subunit IIA [Spiroplasma tabanidicola]|uniref:PTS sugar transporter subunit IIA n=1 Tax=Spiroplasma tabanidicola TaxID=324079 RepID=A0A6I6C5V3_9MOLU|nr:PTS sugar transporter subunit IIA [Spiroplasma tabanidicola]QGS52277.1 PTS sugar transporter subunit IIA [Spiroplasma tabanidicola]